jgi:DNA-binding NarL/FixJ family response regulator
MICWYGCQKTLTDLHQSTYTIISFCRLIESSHFEYRGSILSRLTVPIRVIIAEHSRAVRDRLTAALSQIPNLKVIATASHGKKAIDLTLKLWPDILLLNASMHGMNGLSVLKVLHQQAASVMVVVLSNHGEPIYRERFLACGAADVLIRGTHIEEIEQAIRGVMERGAASIDDQNSRHGVAVCHTN